MKDVSKISVYTLMNLYLDKKHSIMVRNIL